VKIFNSLIKIDGITIDELDLKGIKKLYNDISNKFPPFLETGKTFKT
jgi:hypothetical protein